MDAYYIREKHKNNSMNFIYLTADIFFESIKAILSVALKF